MAYETITAMETYRQFARYYDGYVQRFTQDFAMYGAYCQPEDRILEVGCGTGRVLRYLLGRGCQVTGVDISGEMLEIAHQRLAAFERAGQLRLRNHDLLNRPLTGAFDCVFVTFYTFNYLIDAPERFFSNLRSALADRAILLIDLFVPTSRAASESEAEWHQHDFEMDGRRIVVNDRRYVVHNRETRTQIYEDGERVTEITTTRRYFSPTEMRDLLMSAGFQQIEFSTSYDPSEFADTMSIEPLTSHFVVKASFGSR